MAQLNLNIFPLLGDSVDPTRLLLTFNVSVNLGDKYHKNTALHWAVLAGNTTVISLLLDANANVDAQNIKVRPIHGLTRVCGNGKSGVNNETVTYCQGETPLDLAKQRKNVWMINHLQEARQAKGYDSPSYLKRLKMDKVGTGYLFICKTLETGQKYNCDNMNSSALPLHRGGN